MEKRFLILNVSDLDNVNFDQVMQTSAETCRRSVDGTKAFVKYLVNIITEDISETCEDPETGETNTVTLAAGVYGRPDIYTSSMTEYTHAEMLELLVTPEWASPAAEDAPPAP